MCCLGKHGHGGYWVLFQFKWKQEIQDSLAIFWTESRLKSQDDKNCNSTKCSLWRMEFWFLLRNHFNGRLIYTGGLNSTRSGDKNKLLPFPSLSPTQMKNSISLSLAWRSWILVLSIPLKRQAKGPMKILGQRKDQGLSGDCWAIEEQEKELTWDQ